MLDSEGFPIQPLNLYARCKQQPKWTIVRLKYGAGVPVQMSRDKSKAKRQMTVHFNNYSRWHHPFDGRDKKYTVAIDPDMSWGWAILGIPVPQREEA